MKLDSELLSLLDRNPDCNKGDFGHVLIIGGDYGMAGAVIMAAEAAYRAGAGRVSVLTREENFTALLARLPNVMTVNSYDEKDIFAHKTVIVVGCGLGKTAWAKALLNMALATDLPKVIDADALNIISESDKLPILKNAIITPHPLEAARLLNCDVNAIQQDRKNAVQSLRRKFFSVAVLKGKNSLICDLAGEIHQCQFGNAGMAVAGMGDVLSGIIGALLAQKLSLEQAAILGVDLHAFAADLVAQNQGEIGMLPSDVVAMIPYAINSHKVDFDA